MILVINLVNGEQYRVDLRECTVKFYETCLVVNVNDSYSREYVGYSKVDSIKLEER